jgi:fatty-acyl-CoA synthase
LNLWDSLTSARDASLHCWQGERFESARWGVVVRDAQAMTAGLRRAGVAPGTRVAAVLTNGPQAVRGVLGVWLAGGALASLPVPARGMDAEEYAAQLIAIVEGLQPVALLIEERMRPLLAPLLQERFTLISWESLVGSGSVDASPPGEDELAFIQYSSGSTSAPKGCALTPRAIAAQIELIAELIGAWPQRDVNVSWLPLSHDMGMFGCLLTPWAYDFELYLSSPERFALSPRTWFGDAARCGATITAGTSTGLYLSARAYRGAHRLPQDLSLRVCIVGAERVEWETLELATSTFEPYGFRKQALMPAYGLAEATLAVTATPMHEAPRRVLVDALELADGRLSDAAPDDPAAASLVGAGPPCSGVSLGGVGADAEGVAEIRVRSRSLASGYFADSARTRERFRDGELHTGDLGFVRDGHLYPVGRLDDMISIGGRNVYAREIETAVDMLDGVRRGCSTIVERPDDAARLTLCVELRDAGDDYRSLADRAASVAMAKAAVALDECVFLERGSLPKTPSGKIQRHRCRRMLSDESLRPLARIRLAAR